MENDGKLYRSVVELASPAVIGFLFAVVVVLLVFGVVGTFVISADSLSSLVAGIIFLIVVNFFIIFRQVVVEVDKDEVAISCGMERAWVSRGDITSVEPLEMTFGRRCSATLSLGPWSAMGRDKIHYFGQKAPMVLIRSSDGRNFAVSVEDSPEVVRMLSP